MALAITYILRHVFLFCEEECRNSIYRTCKLWRKNAGWVNPRVSYLKCVNVSNFKFAKMLFDCYGEYFADNSILMAARPHKELCSHILRMLDYNSITSLAEGSELGWAAFHGHMELVNKLLENPFSSNVDEHAIIHAVIGGHLLIVDRLFEIYLAKHAAKNKIAYSHTDVNDHLELELVNNIVENACEYGCLDIVDKYLPLSDPSDNDNSAIVIASGCGHLDIVDRLLQDARVDPSAQIGDAMRRASMNGHLAVINRLLEDPRVNPWGDPIMNACEYGHIQIVERLLKDPRAELILKHESAIIVALDHSRLEIAKLLLKDPRALGDADTGSEENVANTALYFACSRGYTEIVQILLKDSRSNPSANDNRALRGAELHEHPEVVTLLQQHITMRLLRDPRVTAIAHEPVTN